ncbi:MAG TPA: L,D-transpeptidase [Ktedonobacterales bacterium]|nr:L,D-transpeptidase [Ktedonobacterales bacterium]
MRNDPPVEAGALEPLERSDRRHRLRRALLVGLCAAILLTLIGAGGVFAARRYATARHVAPAPVANFTIPLAPIVRPGSPSQQAPAPEAVADCPCSAAHANIPAPSYGVPQVSGQVVLVSITQQWLWAYQDQRLVMASAVTTGMPQLPTPTGTYHITMKESNVWFYSPWPYGSPYYYTPEHVDYAMLFRSGGFYLHSAAWRHAFGPGANVPHTDPDGTWETGSHGCVNLPVDAAGALYGWIGIGATVIIVP